MSPTIPGAIKRNVYLYSDDHTEKRDTQLPDVEWVNDEIDAEAAARIAADQQLQANIDAEETRAKAAEATLQANIDAEETRAKAAEVTLQANIDAEETRAEAAEALKEDKANKVTSTSTYVSNDTKYPTTAAVDARIAEISPTEVEYATQNVTTFAQIKAWLNAGKLVVAKCGDGENELYVTDIYDDSVFFCRVSGTYSERYIVDSDGWHLSSNSLEQTGNKLASTATWTSDDTKYPTAKAVENYVAANAPKGVEWATYGTTTYSQIKTWNDAGKAVFLKYTVGGPVDYIMKLTIVTPGGAFFCGIQGISEYTAEVNPANQWSYNTSGLQASALVHEYETWDESNDTSYPSLASVSNYVASHSGSDDVFWATYGTTTGAQIAAAYNAGQEILLKGVPNHYEIYQLYRYPWSEDASGEWVFNSIYEGQQVSGGAWRPRLSRAILNSGTWSYEDCELNPAQSSGATWSSDDLHWPTNKAVENYVASHSGPIKIASTSNTASEIFAWEQAGNAVFLQSGGDLYALQYCNATNAYFTQIYAPGGSTDPQLYWYMVSGSSWTTGNYYLQKKDNTQELLANKLASTATWVSNDTKYPTTQSVANYVATHAGGDVYDIAVPSTIPVTCDTCFYDDAQAKWSVKFNGSGTMYGPHINFKLLKNGNELQLTSDVKIVAEPYVSSGTKTYSSGQYFNAPSAPSWGAMSQESNPSASSGKYFGIKILQSSASTSPDNSSIYIRYPGGNSYTGSSGLDPKKCYFVLSLYVKSVSESVPVAHKVIQIVPTLMANSLDPGITWFNSTESSLNTKINTELTNGRFPGIVDSSSGTAKFFFYAGKSGLIHYFIRPYWKPTYETNYDWTNCYEKGQVSGAGTWQIDSSEEMTFYAYTNKLTHWQTISGSGYKHQYDLTTLKVSS